MSNLERDKILEEALKALKESNYNGFVIAPTGVGKSYILIQALKKIKPKGTIWYLCDSELNRDETFKNELIKWGAEKYIDKIEFMCYQTACKIHGAKVDLVLGDEVDFALTSKYKLSLENNKFNHKVLVSATLSPDKRKLAKAIAPIIYEKGLHDIEGEGIVNDSKFYIVNYMLYSNENNKYLGYNNTFVKHINQGNKFKIEQTQIMRRLFLSTLSSSSDACKRLLKDLYPESHRKILIFCGTADQADRICKYSFHSKNNDIGTFKDFDEGKIRILSVVGKVDRGVNINGVNTVIFEAPPRSNTKWQQKSGRGRRLHVDDTLDIYFLVPYYKDKYGKVKPTIVEKYVRESVGKLKINPEIIWI